MLTPNTTLQNRYQIVRSIGQGGMGAVYLARDQRLGNTVALKETFFTDVRMRRAFEREARLLAHLRHPALPKVIDHFDEGDGQFLVMEFIPGDDLEILLAQRSSPFPHERVLEWADELLKALDYLHKQDPPILHRDIKPSNLKLTSQNEIILLDFGLAKGSVGQMSSVATSRSVLGFTPNFAPLEQIQGTGTGPFSDIYALAATLYYLMTSVIPPDALSRAASVLGKQPDPLRRADEVNPQVPEAIATVLERAMSLDPVERPADAGQMRSALKTASQQPSAAAVRAAAKTEVLPENDNGDNARARMPTENLGTLPSPTLKTTGSEVEDKTAAGNLARPFVKAPVAKSKTKLLPLVISAVAVLAIVGALIAYYASGSSQAVDGTLAGPLIVSQAGDGQFKTIGEAIRKAKPGAQIQVRAGVYQESLVLDREVEIVGDPKAAGQVIVEGAGASALVMQTDNATVRGLTLRTRGAVKAAYNTVPPGAWHYTAASYAPSQQPTDPYKDPKQQKDQNISPVTRKGARVSDEQSNRPINNGNSNRQQPRTTTRRQTQAANKSNAADTRAQNPSAKNENSPQAGLISPPVTTSNLTGYPAVVVGRGKLVLENCDITADSNVVVMVRGASASAVIRGGSRIHDGKGVGVAFLEQASGELTGCEISGNALYGVQILEGRPTVRDCKINGNSYAVWVGKVGRGDIVNNDLRNNTNGAWYIEVGGVVSASNNTEGTGPDKKG